MLGRKMLGERWYVQFTPALIWCLPRTQFQLSWACQVLTIRCWGRLVAGPKPRDWAAVLKMTFAGAWSSCWAVGEAAPETLLPPNSTFKRPNETRTSLTMWALRLCVQLIKAAWLSAGTLKKYPAAPLSLALKKLLRLKI